MFHQHPARELYNKFADQTFFPMFVAKAIVDGVLSEKEVPIAVREALSDKITFFENELPQGSSRHFAGAFCGPVARPPKFDHHFTIKLPAI